MTCATNSHPQSYYTASVTAAECLHERASARSLCERANLVLSNKNSPHPSRLKAPATSSCASTARPRRYPTILPLVAKTRWRAPRQSNRSRAPAAPTPRANDTKIYTKCSWKFRAYITCFLFPSAAQSTRSLTAAIGARHCTLARRPHATLVPIITTAARSRDTY